MDAWARIRSRLSRSYYLAAAHNDERLTSRQIEVRVNVYLSHQLNMYMTAAENRQTLQERSAQLHKWLRPNVRETVDGFVQTYVEHLYVEATKGLLRQKWTIVYSAHSLDRKVASLAQQIDIRRTVHIKPVYDFVDFYNTGPGDHRHPSLQRQRALDLLAADLVFEKPEDWLDMRSTYRRGSRDLIRDSFDVFNNRVRS